MKKLAVAGVAVIAALTLGIGACSDEAAPPLPTASTSDTGSGDGTATTGGAPVDDTDTTGSSEAASSSTATPTTTPPTTLPPLVTDGAEVLVANAADVPGAAGRLTNALAQVGYATNPPTNGAGWETRLETSKIYYLPPAKRAARSLARRMGVEISPMPVPVPITGAYEFFGDTTLVIMLGRDLADRPIPGITG